MAAAARRPNFLVIGAARSGTTALHHLLARHPEVFVPRLKEPNFFACRDGRIEAAGPGSRWVRETSVCDERRYFALFDGVRDEKAVGEVSPRYLYTSGTAALIRARLPDARIVAVLRNPADRAFASFVSLRRDGIEPEPDFRKALREEPARIAAGWPLGRYVDGGSYAAHLAPYFDAFPRERIRIYLHEDLHADPIGFQRDLFAFLGVDRDAVAPRIAVHNRSAEIGNPLLAAVWRRTHALRTRLRPLVPALLRDHALDRMTRSGAKPVLDPELRAEINEGLRADIEALERLIGRDLRHWLGGGPDDRVADVRERDDAARASP